MHLVFGARVDEAWNLHFVSRRPRAREFLAPLREGEAHRLKSAFQTIITPGRTVRQ
jgi:hypothetical protein